MAFWLWLALCIGIIVIATCILLSPIRVRVRYSRSGKLDQLVVVTQAFYGLFHYQVILPSIVIKGWNVIYSEERAGDLTGANDRKQKKRMIGKGTIRRYFKGYKTLLQSTRKFKQWTRQSLKKVECTRWRLDFRVGTGDAAETAVVTGLLWAVAGCASGIAGQIITLKTSPQSQISPNYSAEEFTVVWEADFRVRMSAVLGSILKLGTSTIQFGKAIKAWRNWMRPPKQV